MTSRITLYESLNREIETPQLPARLRELHLIEAILDTPCQVRLTQRRYEKVERTQQFTLTAEHRQAELYLCLLNSILYHITMTTDKSSCMDGYLHIVVRNSQVLSSASAIRIPRNRCDLMYVPIYVTEIHSDAQQRQAENAKRAKVRWFCSNCRPGHAMGLFIDRREKTLQVYDSNGTISDYYRKIVNWIERRLEREWKLGFPGYSVVNDLEVPQFGIQTNTNIQMCAYFSSLYAALRLQNPQVLGLELNRLLLEVPRSEIEPLLNRWHCYLIGYAKSNGILDVFERIKPLFNRVFMRLLNYKFYGIHLSANQVEQYWNSLESVKSFSDTNIFKAEQILENIEHELAP